MLHLQIEKDAPPAPGQTLATGTPALLTPAPRRINPALCSPPMPDREALLPTRDIVQCMAPATSCVGLLFAIARRIIL